MRVYLGRDPVTTKKRWKSRSFHGGKRAARGAMAAFVTEVQRDKPSTDQTVAWLVDVWFAVQERAQLSPTTLRTYRGYAANWIVPSLGERALKDLTAGDVRDLHTVMREAGKTDSTIRQVHAILRGALSYALEKEWVDRNVAALRRPPKQPTPGVVAADLDEVGALLSAAGERGSDLWTCIALAATLGARAGELCALRWSDIDFEGGMVTIARSVYAVKGGAGIKPPKSGHGRRVAIDELTAAVLRERWAWQLDRNERVGTDLIDDPFVLSFWSTGDGPPRPDSYSTAFARVRDELGLSHLHLHSLRHFMVSHSLDQGIPLPVVSERAGHSSPAVTARIYAHGAKGRDAEAAAILGKVLAPPK
jgi:integrase